MERFASQATQIVVTEAIVIATDHHPMIPPIIPMLSHFVILSAPLDLSSLCDTLAFSSPTKLFLASARDGESY